LPYTVNLSKSIVVRWRERRDGVQKKHCVLVVDDHPRVLRFIEIDLKLRGFEVITTTSGGEALKLVKSKKPDVMLLDIIMPEMDGFDVLKQLRAFSQLPVIAFSADHANQDDALNVGADDFITKPFHPDEMVRRIDVLLGS
jgi:two-component system KDP operon response regulator KdpE